MTILGGRAKRSGATSFSQLNHGDWRGALLEDAEGRGHGSPPVGSANLAWVQHFIHDLVPTGIAGFVLANGSMLCNQSDEGEICRISREVCDGN